MKDSVVGLLVKFTGYSKKELCGLVEVPKDHGMGDYAFPCFSLSKRLKMAPGEIAKDIAKKINEKPRKDFEKIQAVGPYVNFYINKKSFAGKIIDQILKEKDRFGSGRSKEKIVLELVSPNTNKPLHLGHVRNMVFGQSVSRINKFLGKDVKTVCINNDRGIHICKSMIAYDKFGKGKNPKTLRRKSDHFVGDYYVKYNQEVEKNPGLEEEAKQCLVKWEAGDKKTLDLWKKMNSWAYNGWKETYNLFGLKFNKEYYESEIYKKGKEIVLKALKKGIVNKKEDGAIFIDLSDKGLGEKILLRSDGTSIYIIFDLDLAVQRHNDFRFDKMLYVVANEQNYHFKVLFELLKRFGYPWAGKLHHLNYGMINLESGRMKSRQGTIVDADDLINDLKNLAVKEVEKRYKNLHASEISNRAFAIAMAALRYYLLKIERNKDTTFKPKESISFEGDTGPYLLYSYARALSILEKANYKKVKKPKIPEVNEFEKRLLTAFAKFPEVVKHAANGFAPNEIANYSYNLAKTFSDFYHNSRVIGSEEEQFRLKLVDCFSLVMKNALSLLEIAVIRKM